MNEIKATSPGLDDATTDADKRDAATHDQPARSDTPQIRTLLLTDLVDSTSLVERIGDGPAAELFRAHDRLVLELQQRWRGRLIDRSDGLLLLFERPVDALGFALDYNRGLRALGERPELQQRHIVLQARAGLHVGEVLTWRNSEAAVQAGAKPLEVEGIAKPLAGRLMMLARPGQILLSATAEPMAHRSARELGARSEHLIWKSHGRWRLKGVPDAQEIFEVGEPGFAPLRAPRQNHAKAWRDIPLWRRPAALAAEVLLLVGIGTGAWFVTRPTPAIAFNERDWVVVGDLRNLTGQAVLDESLEQAFRISLEQSRYVNVLSDLKVRETLALMKRKADTPLDRAIASEIAIRDGARAVILPTVSEVGGRVRVSAEVVDPHSQATVYAESADGNGAVSTLDSIDTVTAELREKLGEALAAIERDSAPLPQVSTRNLDALKLYALGRKSYFAGEIKDALGYFQRAIELDPQFALARLSAGYATGAVGDFPSAKRYLNEANDLRAHLAPREILTLDADIARFGPVEPMLQRWTQLVALYPDSHGAHLSLAQEGMFYLNRYQPGLAHARAAAVPQFSGQAKAHYLTGMLQLGMDRYAESIKAFEAARRAGYKGQAIQHAYAYAAQRDYAKAESVLGTRRSTGMPTGELQVPYTRMLLALDRGRMLEAEAAARDGLSAAEKAEPVFAGADWRIRKLTTAMLAGREGREILQSRLLQEIERTRSASSKTDALYPSYSENLLLGIGYLGGRMDSLPVVERALASIESSTDITGYPVLVQMRAVLLAERDRLAGNPRDAVKRLAKLSELDQALVPVHMSLLRAARASGETALAMREARWMMVHRGRAFMEQGANELPTPINVADTTSVHLDAAELLLQLGRKDEARAELAIFLGFWPKAMLSPGLAERVDRLQG